MHNFDDVGRMNVNRASFAALKSGGIYGVVDHTRRHNEVHNDENRRRADPVTIIEEVQAAGFVFAGSSDLHYRATDELTKEVGEDGVSGVIVIVLPFCSASLSANFVKEAGHIITLLL